MKYILFNSVGNLEKDLVGTAVIQSIRQEFPSHSIIVVSNNPEVWLHNPNIYRVYKAGQTPYFFDDYVKDKDSIILWQDPYATDDFLQKRKHIIEIWCELCKVPYKKTKPQLFFTQREQEVTKKILGLDKPTNPIFLVQTHSENYGNIPYVWTHDITTKLAQDIVEIMHKKGYKVIHVRTGKEPVLAYTDAVSLNIRQIFCAINISDARLFINSFTQHVASALGKKSIVFWVAGNPLVSGYPININVVPDAESKLGLFLKDFNESFVEESDLMIPPFPIDDFYSAKDISDLLSNI